MTAAQSLFAREDLGRRVPSSAQAWSNELAKTLRGRLTAMLGRRVPPAHVEDIAQTVLCDALSAPAIPDNPEDLRRWVTAIAKHKVVDFHRRARRHACEELDEPSVCPAAFEERNLLGAVLATARERDPQTADWILREHAGEHLSAIAEEAGLPAPVVRQRVSRLRRALRSRFGAALAVLVAVGTGSAVTQRAISPGAAEIVAEPSVEIGNAVGALLGANETRWSVESLHLSGDVPVAERALLEVEARVAEAHVVGARVSLWSAGRVGRVTRTIVLARASGGGEIEIELQDAAGHRQRAAARLSGDRLTITVHNGAGRGTAVFVRAPSVEK